MRRLLCLTSCLVLGACGGKAISHAGEGDEVGGVGGYGAVGGFGSGGGMGSGGWFSTGGMVSGAGGALATGGAGQGGQPELPPRCEPYPLPGEECRLRWAGVNLFGAEFGDSNPGGIPGTFEMDYTYPGAADVDYFASKGMTIIRLPFRWERLQRTLGGALDATELGRIKAVVALAKAKGMTIILDPHNYARYRIGDTEHLIGDGTVTQAHFANFWGKLAGEFKAESSVIFGLMNEPHDMSTSVWVDAANAALVAIRNSGAVQLVLVPGNYWTGAHSWTTTDNAYLMPSVVDPAGNFAYEAHQYLDSNYSGLADTCSVADAESVLGSFTDWLRAHGARGFLGEFGAGTGDDCHKAIISVLDHLENNADVWSGWTYWAAGPWWTDYFTSLTPITPGQDKPQMNWLQDYLP